ncbi:MAG: tetratricopeptide repeat protein [Candidatus Sumerlaeia bacterium]|nr:tetratricopeptide repeat protein [Candidatus Sumerlaeia bacterium]
MAPGEVVGKQEEVEELLEAFHSQFIDRNLNIPKGWAERLERLALEAEPSRRYATIIFVDLVGYTRLSQVLEETSLLAMREWFNALCTAEVERFGGFLIQFLGDGAFAAFGAPWAFERDCEAAVRCLLSIRDKVLEKGDFDGEELAIRGSAVSGVINVGVIHEGGHARPDMIGNPVNLAAHMQAHADVFDITIPKSMVELIAPAFALEKRPPFIPKNQTDLVYPFAVLAATDGEVQRRRNDLAFVGRSEELEAFRKATGDLRQSGKYFVIRGEAGIGKTRFARHALSECLPPGRAFHSYLEPHHRHSVLMPFLQLCEWLAESDSSSTLVLRQLRERFPDMEPTQAAAIGVLYYDTDSLNSLSHLPPKQLGDLVQATLLDLIRRAAAEEPMALLFDDLQWCDGFSLRTMMKLAAEVPPGLLLVLIQRPENLELPLGQLVDDGLCIDIGPLDDADQVRLLESLSGAHLLNPLDRERLLQDSGGIPLYLIETTMLATEKMGSGQDADQLVAELVEARTLDQYQRIVEIFQARIDWLGERERLTLQCGAILGRSFREKVLSGVDEIRDNLMEYLAFLKGARFLEEEPLPSDRQLTFTPPLLRDISYQMIATNQRKALHRRFAGLIISKFGDEAHRFATDLAHHWLRAGEYASAIPWVRMACQNSLRYGEPQQAYTVARDALVMAPARTGDPLAATRTMLLHEQAAIAAHQLGDPAKALEHIGEWETIAEGAGNQVGLFNAMYRRTQVLLDTADLSLAAEILSRITPATEAQQSRREELRAKLAIRRGDLNEALAIFTSAAENARAGSPGLVADNWNNAALCLQRMGRNGEARDAFHRAAAAFDRFGNPFGQCLVLNNLGILHQNLGELPAAMDVYTKALGLARRSGYVHGLSALEANISLLHLLEDRPIQAIDHAARALHFARLIRHRESEVVALINLALGRSAGGGHIEAIELLGEAITIASTHGYTPLATEGLVEKAVVLKIMGRDEEAKIIIASLPEDLPPDLDALVRIVRNNMNINGDLAVGRKISFVTFRRLEQYAK